MESISSLNLRKRSMSIETNAKKSSLHYFLSIFGCYGTNGMTFMGTEFRQRRLFHMRHANRFQFELKRGIDIND